MFDLTITLTSPVVKAKMYRTLALFRPATASLRLRLPLAAAPLRRSPVLALQASATLSAKRSYAAAAGLSKDDIQSRVLEVMKTFEKVDGGKVGHCRFFFVVSDVSASWGRSGTSAVYL